MIIFNQGLLFTYFEVNLFKEVESHYQKLAHQLEALYLSKAVKNYLAWYNWHLFKPQIPPFPKNSYRF